MLAYAAPVDNGDDSRQTGSTTNFASDHENDYTQHINLEMFENRVSTTSSTRSPSSSEFDTLANFFSDYSSSTLSSQETNAVPEIKQTVSDDDTFDRITTSGFSYEPETSTSAEALDDLVRLPIGVTIVIVLASACVVLGLVYAYIYFTQIQMQSRTSAPTNNKPSKKPSSAGGAGGDGRGAGSPSDHQGESHDDGTSGDGAAHSYTHMFLFRKHHHAPTIT